MRGERKKGEKGGFPVGGRQFAKQRMNILTLKGIYSRLLSKTRSDDVLVFFVNEEKILNQNEIPPKVLFIN
jgi:hypothetical protein